MGRRLLVQSLMDAIDQRIADASVPELLALRDRAIESAQKPVKERLLLVAKGPRYHLPFRKKELRKRQG